nr:hypothetical protein [Tanacetum cinerariifolium]
MDDSKQSYVNYDSSRANKMEGKRFTSNQGPRNFNYATNTWKEKPNFHWACSQTFTNPQNESISVHSSSYQMRLEKVISPKNPTRTTGGTKKERIQKHVEVILPKISLSLASIKELNKNPSALKRVHFVNSIVILSKDIDTEEDVSSTNACRRNLDKMMKGNEEVKEEGKDEDEIETNVKVKEEVSFVGNKMHKAFPLPRESSHWQYKFPLPVEGVPTTRRMEIPLPRVCTAMMKKLPVKEKWQLH